MSARRSRTSSNVLEDGRSRSSIRVCTNTGMNTSADPSSLCIGQRGCILRSDCSTECSTPIRSAGLCRLAERFWLIASGLQNQQAVAAPRLDGSIPSPLRGAEHRMGRGFTAAVPVHHEALKPVRYLQTRAFPSGDQAGPFSRRCSARARRSLVRRQYVAVLDQHLCALTCAAFQLVSMRSRQRCV
jgi:hypothetical protein